MNPSIDLAYWVGVAQSDGYLKKYFEKRNGNKIKRNIIRVGVANKSLPMLKHFITLSKNIFETSGTYYIDKKGYHFFDIRISKFINELKNLDIDISDPPKPPIWCLKNKKYYGAYLAGLIDGDGNVKIARKNTYPQCLIRIYSGHAQTKLKESIKLMLKCECHQLKSKRSNCYNVGFLVTYKNYIFFENYILRYINLSYKRSKIQEFINFKIKGG